MLSYVRQVAISESVREKIKGALHQSDDVGIRLKANNLPANESILRAVSLLPAIDTEETLKDFIVEHMMSSLRLTAIQREQLDLNR
jgi:hypothetical protein